MSDERALLHAVLADPDDDLPRLAYADWLEERGDAEQLARADFIRTQIALAHLPDDDPDWPALTVREATLLNAHGQHWQKDVAKAATHFVFRRGFIDEVSLTLPMLLRRGKQLLNHAPVTLLRLFGDGNDDPRDLARWPLLHRVRGLDLSQLDVRLPGARDVFQSPQVTGLRRLHLGRIPFPWDAGRWLRDATALHSLRELRLTNFPFGNEEFEDLVQASWFPALTHLAVINQPATAASIDVLLRHLPHGLTALDLSGANLTTERADLLAQGHLPQLRELSLTNAHLRPDGLAALLQSPLGQTLTALDVRTNLLGDEAAKLLANAPSLAGLTRLGVSLPVGVGTAELADLFNSPHLRRLVRLNVSQSHVEAEKATALADSRIAATLTHLDLSGNAVRARGIMALANSARLRRLTHLSLGGGGLRDQDVGELASSPILANVVELNLRGCTIRDRGLEALATSPHLGSHTTLHLSLGHPRLGALRSRFPGRVAGDEEA